ncbi:lamin tail domain-containing protein [Haladaptatus paucihalophilus]|uniref:LTD domain-containing protein n=2 Tax=Haladaptatus paucihalophilus DX253 TaxID=797209 RepID=A0A1M6ZXT0_HALPU|nr:lamin tail domain-containing protein [Haladaptatus paucihalophilus]SHL35291.1 hypothetical protein SAMN05444342_3619 [Haladaptatus paucihalophilus DX253]
MKQTRRSVLGAIGAVATVGVGATQVLGADSNVPLLLDPYPGEEYLLVKNTTDSPFSLDGHYVDFEYVNDGEDQRYSIPSGYTIPAGGTIKIATGAGEVPEGAIDMDQPDYEMNNSEADVYAILDADKNVVARSDQEKYRASIDPSEETTTDETTTEEEDTTDDSDDSESSDSSSDDTQSDDDTDSDESESSESDDSEESESDDSSSEEDSQDDC